MFVPSMFQMSDPTELHAFMRLHGFAILVTHGTSGMVATHLPLHFDASAGPHGALLGHMARANPQWRDIAGEAMAIFSGPHAYISPTWYETPGNVPTWNYVAVHAYGNLQIIEDNKSLHDILTRTASFYEQGMPKPWSYDIGDPGIVGFRIEISRLEGKAKLNQNHPEERRLKVIRALEVQHSENSQSVAKLMAAR
ncbi:MAG: FMN-binding negative transcriptional regulator [Gemmataceae bacterium]